MHGDDDLIACIVDKAHGDLVAFGDAQSAKDVRHDHVMRHGIFEARFVVACDDWLQGVEYLVDRHSAHRLKLQVDYLPPMLLRCIEGIYPFFEPV